MITNQKCNFDSLINDLLSLAGIYIHIPFCKKACTYCDFHFSTVRKNQSALVDALCLELQLRKSELFNEKIETVYFGGGTPSLLNLIEWNQVFSTLQKEYNILKSAEITVEANPDDLSEDYLRLLHSLGVNRLSIGIQSFYDDYLNWMNRAHNAKQSVECIKTAQKIGISNISIDLIYGIPTMPMNHWIETIDKAIDLKVPHISCYNLTVEPKTKLAHQIKIGSISPIDDEQSHLEYEVLCERLEKAGFVHYEISNFGKLGYFSAHNTSYWQGKNYIGIGPSAHSFNQKERKWNISNNSKYIDQINKSVLPNTVEMLTPKDLFNEHLLIGLRTIWGCNLDYLKSFCNLRELQILITRLKKMETEGFIQFDSDLFYTTNLGKSYADKLASDLFLID